MKKNNNKRKTPVNHKDKKQKKIKRRNTGWNCQANRLPMSVEIAKKIYIDIKGVNKSKRTDNAMAKH